MLTNAVLQEINKYVYIHARRKTLKKTKLSGDKLQRRSLYYVRLGTDGAGSPNLERWKHKELARSGGEADHWREKQRRTTITEVKITKKGKISLRVKTVGLIIKNIKHERVRGQSGLRQTDWWFLRNRSIHHRCNWCLIVGICTIIIIIVWAFATNPVGCSSRHSG